MDMLFGTQQGYVIVADFLFAIILAVVLIIGWFIGKSSGGSRSRDSSSVNHLWHKLNYGRQRGLTYGILWLLFIFFVLPFLEEMNSKLITDIGLIFLLISGAIGFYAAYPVTMWIDKKLPCSDFGLWARRIVSGVLLLVGVGFSVLWLMSIMMTIGIYASRGITQGPWISVTSLTLLIIGFFAGLGLFSGYLEYVFEKRSGFLVFQGHQKF